VQTGRQIFCPDSGARRAQLHVFENVQACRPGARFSARILAAAPNCFLILDKNGPPQAPKMF